MLLGHRCVGAILAGAAMQFAVVASLLHTRVHAATPSNETSRVAYFPPGSVWFLDIRQAPIDPNSDGTIQWLARAGGWGTGRMRVDFSLRVLRANDSTPRVPFRPAPGFYRPDSDVVPSVPLPVGGGMEGQPSYHCPVEQQDCHLIVVDQSHNLLYEAFAANYDGKDLSAVLLVVWDLNRVYPPSGRGDQCTSADAAGFPIAPLLFNADELAAGHIDHALRFILPNNRIRAGVFIRPASHAGGPKGPSDAPPYGVHLRLKSSYDIHRLKPAARVVASAMQTYGIFLADGGNVALTAQNDTDTRAKYAAVGFDANDLASLNVTDFEVLKEGPAIPLTYDCMRNH
jgi:hypothetical protein